MADFLRADVKIGVLTYAQELVSGTATLLEDLPAVGVVCKSLLAFESLVERARTNKEELVVLRELCEVVFNALVVERRSEPWERTGLQDGLDALARHVERAKAVANLCHGNRFKQLALSRKICKEIAAVRKDVLDFSATINVVITNDLHVSECFLQSEREKTRLRLAPTKDMLERYALPQCFRQLSHKKKYFSERRPPSDNQPSQPTRS